MVETIGAPEGGSYEFDARVIGVGAAAVALRAGAGTLPAVGVAALQRLLVRRDLLGEGPLEGPADEITSAGLERRSARAHGRRT